MTERDVITVARALALLVEDANATLSRMVEAGWTTPKGTAVVLAWQERAAKALEDAGALL
jgi:hypothetical protein